MGCVLLIFPSFRLPELISLLFSFLLFLYVYFCRCHLFSTSSSLPFFFLQPCLFQSIFYLLSIISLCLPFYLNFITLYFTLNRPSTSVHPFLLCFCFSFWFCCYSLSPFRCFPFPTIILSYPSLSIHTPSLIHCLLVSICFCSISILFFYLGNCYFLLSMFFSTAFVFFFH